ncbi:hypothetical protein [Pseudoxanthomonas sp.]|uniref:hypothetical protein n=1 Tax=Pseudoxanthomonas sp. TaxID=1871049 RepID=UPI002631B0EB|nr:hypothetical protein [Pseudoxanthomonas sp.]WDS35854.1 MAG: hypothetical protein O8I58_16285 [Pseudoxanthomonas sp.]
MSTSVTELANIGLKAIVAQQAIVARKAAAVEYRGRLADWKAAHGILEHLPTDHLLLHRMCEEVGSSATGMAYGKAKTAEKNAKARLLRAVRKVRLATAAQADAPEVSG